MSFVENSVLYEVTLIQCLIVKADFRFEDTEHIGVASEMDAIDNTGRFVPVQSAFALIIS